MEMLLELVLALVLGALGIGAPIEMRLRKALGHGIIPLIMKGLTLPEPPPPPAVPTFGDFINGQGKFKQVDKAVYDKAVATHPPEAQALPIGMSGKPAMVTMLKLNNDKLAFAVRWPSGFYYYLEESMVD